MNIAKVVIDIQTQSLDAPYDYRIPDNLLSGGDAVRIGSAVMVPFGPRKVVGFVVDIQDVPEIEINSSDEPLSTHVDDYSSNLENSFATESNASRKPNPTAPVQVSLFGEEYSLEADTDRSAGTKSNCDDHSATAVRDPEPGTSKTKKGKTKSARIKDIDRVVGGPYFNAVGADCALWMAQRYIAPLSSCVRLFAPPGGVPKAVKSSQGFWYVDEPEMGQVDDRWLTLEPAGHDFSPRKGAVKQEQILAVVRKGDVKISELTAEFGSVASAVAALEKKGVVRVERRRRMRHLASTTTVASSPHQLNSQQQHAVDVISKAVTKQAGDVVVVDGVTGSGKTEVYLHAIAQVLAAGGNAIVLVPEISLTPQTVARFRGRFGDQVAVLHSRMSQGERFDQWDAIAAGQAHVVVGARSALFAPLSDVKLIIIDEEHEGTYKQESAPRYVSRDVARWMMQRSGGALVLGSATPSVEALNACDTDPSWHRVVLSVRANGKPMPRITVVDMAKQFGTGDRSMFGRELTTALQRELELDHKAVLLLNQRGFAKFVLCRECGFVPMCEHCSTSLTYHEKGNMLVCHHCGYKQPCPPVCPECHSPYLKKFGAGTQRVESELRALIASFSEPASNARIIRMDADTTQRKGAHQKLLEEFASPGPAVLLGTQMIAKGLDFNDVTLVGVINADTQLNLPDFRASERTFDLIEQVAGRAGRAELSGEVIVQTYNASAEAIRYAASYDRESWLEQEMAKRSALGYPPYVRIANVLVWGKREQAVQEEAQALETAIRAAVQQSGLEEWEVLPATPCALSKLRETFRWHVVVKAPKSSNLSDVLGVVMRNRKASDYVSAAIDIDPASLF